MSQRSRHGEPTQAVIVECDLAEKPEMVWRALTVPELVAEWLGPNTLRANAGEPFTVQVAPEEGGVITCEVLEAVPHERLSYSWRATEPDPAGRVLDTVVRFELTPTLRGGTHLRVIHCGLEASLATPVTMMMGSRRGLAPVRRQWRLDCRARGRFGRSARPLLGMPLRRAA